MMSLVLIVLGVLLVCWGGVLLLTGEFVATLDIAAGLVSSGVIVIALAAIVRALERLGDRFPVADEEEGDELPLAAAETATSPVFPVSTVPMAVAAAEPAMGEPAITAPEFAMPVAEPETPQPVPAAVETEPPRPALIREGVIDGRVYRFFDDGSIEAEGPEGIRRFKSMDEAREAILQERRPTSTEETPPEAAKPNRETAAVEKTSEAKAEPSPRQPIFPTPPREERPETKPAEAAPIPLSRREAEEPKQRRPVTWESYLAAGRIQENGEKAEAKPASDERGKAEEPTPPEAKADEPPRAEPPSGAWAEPFRALLQDDKVKKGKPEKERPAKEESDES